MRRVHKNPPRTLSTISLAYASKECCASSVYLLDLLIHLHRTDLHLSIISAALLAVPSSPPLRKVLVKVILGSHSVAIAPWLVSLAIGEEAVCAADSNVQDQVKLLVERCDFFVPDIVQRC